VTVFGNPEFTSAGSTDFVEDEAGTFRVTADGDTPTFAAGPGLPSGVTLASDGDLSGTPAPVSGPFPFTITATDAHGDTSTQSFTLYVVPGGPLRVSTTSLPDAQRAVRYAAQLEAANGTSPYAWSLVSGDGKLPAGLSLKKNGVISGTPTSRAESSTFTVRVTDKTKSTATAAFTITVP
jgi:hypothetical protein